MVRVQTFVFQRCIPLENSPALNKCISYSTNSRELKLGRLLDMISSFQNQVPEFFHHVPGKSYEGFSERRKKTTPKKGYKSNVEVE